MTEDTGRLEEYFLNKESVTVFYDEDKVIQSIDHLIYIDNNQLVSLFVSLCTDLSKIWIFTCANNNQLDLYTVSTSKTVHIYQWWFFSV